MIKVCHISSAHNSNDVRILQKECYSLAKHGFDVYFVVQGNSRFENGVHIKGIGEKPDGRIKRMFFFTRKAYKKALEIDASIYHFHDPELLPYAVKLAKKGKKVIFDSHENYRSQIKAKPYIPKIVRTIISNLYYFYETYTLRYFAAAIIPALKDNKNIFKGRIDQYQLIDNVPLREKFDRDTLEGIIKEKQICYAGSISYERGVTHLVKAAAKSKIKLVLAGSFSSKKYKEELFHMPESKWVEYLGELPFDKVIEVYSRSMIGMCTILNVGQYNKSDNFATKVYEYMAVKLPVILSDSKYGRKVMKKYKFGLLVNPKNVNEISAAIHTICKSKEQQEKMGEAGYKAFQERYNWDIEEDKLLRLYKSIL